MRLIGNDKGKRDTNTIGNISESAITTRFFELGYAVYFPYGRDQRYDIVIEDTDANLWRVQCKTGKLEDNGTAITFHTASHNVATKNKRGRHYRGQCDYFAVYCEELHKVYLIPVDEVGIDQAKLRLAPTKNNQTKFVRWAKDYEL